MNINNWLVNTKHIAEMLVSLSVFKEVHNWQMLLLDYAGLLRKGNGTIVFKNGYSLAIRWGTTDKWTIHETNLRDDYKAKKIAQQSKIVIDLGANIGVFSILVAKVNGKVKVYAFEPDPNNFYQLVENVQRNNLSSQIRCFQTACAKETGFKKLYLSQGHGGHTFINMKQKEYIKVFTQSLRDIFNKNKIETCDLLKLDIEGAEYEVLYSLDISTLHKIRNISMEYHNLSKKGRKNGSKLKKYLKKHGFNVKQSESPQKGVGSLFALNNGIKQRRSINNAD